MHAPWGVAQTTRYYMLQAMRLLLLLLTIYCILITYYSYYTLLPTTCSLLPTPYSLLPTTCSLLPTHYSLLPTPYSLHTARVLLLLLHTPYLLRATVQAMRWFLPATYLCILMVLLLAGVRHYVLASVVRTHVHTPSLFGSVWRIEMK